MTYIMFFYLSKLNIWGSEGEREGDGVGWGRGRSVRGELMVAVRGLWGERSVCRKLITAPRKLLIALIQN